MAGKAGGVLKVPRKTHAKKDAAAALAFKVELADRMTKLGMPVGAKVRIWVADEHRYGLISVVRKVWTLRGHKPVTPCQSKYQWGHLYAALEVDAENASEFFFSPTASLEVSDFFLRQLAESDETAHHIVIWDGAGFHQKPGLHPIPERIHLLQLPAYSPELTRWKSSSTNSRTTSATASSPPSMTSRPPSSNFSSSFWADLKNVLSLIGDGWLLAQVNSSALSYRSVKS